MCRFNKYDFETNIVATDATADRTITLPDADGNIALFTTAPTGAIADGTAGQVLTTDGAGALSFTTASGGASAINDLSEKTMNFKYRDLARKLSQEAINKFFLEDKKIFQKNPKKNDDIFLRPIDIGDNTIPNGNAIMLINLVKLGMMEEAKKLSESLNGYLNVNKNHMMTAIRALDFFNNINSGKNCNEQGCELDV